AGGGQRRGGGVPPLPRASGSAPLVTCQGQPAAAAASAAAGRSVVRGGGSGFPPGHGFAAVLRAEDGRLRDRAQRLGGHHAGKKRAGLPPCRVGVGGSALQGGQGSGGRGAAGASLAAATRARLEGGVRGSSCSSPADPARLPPLQVLLGLFFNVHSAVLIEDVPATEKDFTTGVSAIHALYDQVSYNCFIAAGLYFILGGFCFCQVRLNKRKEYLVR
uniref:Ribonuclease K n=1 Tax=Naja naja TaxID=35670 RepID=A0A8C6Y8H5_NAJNA